MKSKSANKLERRASCYGGEVRYEMIVYLEGDNDSSPYMLTLTSNSLDLARTDIPTPQMHSLSRPSVKSETGIKTPSWFKGKPNTKEAKEGVKSLSTSCILGITSSESTGYDVLPYKMTVYHLSAGKIPSLSSKVEIMESYFFFNSHSDSQNLKLELGIPECKARWLILINPAGGKGQAKIYYEKAKPILESAGIEIVLHETRYKDDAYTYIQEISKEDFRKIDTIVCCSGDGIIHEIINGFYQRPDYKELVLRIGALPGGSGCALLYNSLKERGLDFTLDNAIYLLLRGEFQNMPIFKYKLEPYHRPVGYLADVDFGSEAIRFMGSSRFDIFGAFKLVMPTTVNASIVTKPVVAKVANNDIDPYLSISVSLLPYLTQTFAFDGVGFHCLTRKDNLIPFVLNKSSRKCQKIDRFEATGLNGHLISIDGELYKADAVEGVLLEAAETQEETKVEIIEEKPSPGNNYVIGKKMFLGRVLRIA